MKKQTKLTTPTNQKKQTKQMNLILTMKMPKMRTSWMKQMKKMMMKKIQTLAATSTCAG